jgi:hypothetical protein
MSQEEGEQLSALTAGVHSLARGAGQQVGGGQVRQTAGANLGVMAYEMAMLVRRLGMHLTAVPRSSEHPAAR